MIILAHDGSIYGDWVARYAMRFAENEVDRKLRVLHVREGKIHPDIVTTRLDALGTACKKRDISFQAQLLELEESTYRTLRHHAPPDPEALLICGTRAKSSKKRWLRGSVAEQLLRMHQCPVLALRVVQPGLLGHPSDLFLPLAGHQTGFERLWPVFKRLAPQLDRVHLFRTAQLNQLRIPYLSETDESTLRQTCITYLQQARNTMLDKIDPLPFSLELRTSICSDWPHEILVQASRLKSHLMLLGVSERSLAHRVLHGPGLERVLSESPCDVGVYRGP